MPSTVSSGLATGLGQGQIPIISGLRAAAVFLVILYHSELSWAPGGLGVLIFFVLSGVLITWSLLKENERKNTVSLRHFYIRRALRIFPAFYVYALLAIGTLCIFRRNVNWPQTISSLLYTANYYQAVYGDPNTALSHTWSLAIEEQFYLVWPAFFVLFRKRPKLLTQATIVTVALVWIYRAVLKYGCHVGQGYFYEAFDTRMDHLLIGCIHAILLFHFHSALPFDTITRLSWTWASLGCLIVSVILESHFADRYRDVWGFAANPVLCALLIPQLIANRRHVAFRWLDHKWVAYLGSISYSLYLYQQFVLAPMRKLTRFAPIPIQLAVSEAV